MPSQQQCGNPLWLQWIREWWDAANQNNAKDRLTYKRAWESMKANPIEFQHPSEAITLTGIGPKLVERLVERLETYCRDEGLPMPQKVQKKRGRANAADNPDEDSEASPPKRAKKSAPKGYVPKPRSGGYAILLTLAELPEGETVGLTKAELQDQAQPLCDASLRAPGDTSKFHTAWSNMGTLKNKLLVYEFGQRPVRYCLTQEGWALAKSMKDAATVTARTDPGQLAQNSTSTSTTGRSSQARRPLTIDLSDDEDIVDATVSSSSLESRIVQKFGSREAFAKAVTDSLLNPGQKLDKSSIDLIQEALTRGWSMSQPVKEPVRTKATTTSTLSQKSTDPAKDPSTITTTTSAPNLAQAPSLSTPMTADVSYQPIVIPPGSFTVELVLDSREVRAKNDRNYIQEQFKQFDLRCQQRALGIGDMLWTAKIHDKAVINLLAPNEREIPEIVLDYVVERKRLDDLDSSIKDKRFLDQKYRLKRSGMKNVIYIIEDYGNLQTMEDQQHTRLVTAMSASQIIDGFFVKRTRQLDQTISYLASVTRMLKEMYESKPLHVIPSHLLTPQNQYKLRAAKDDTGYHHYVTYDAHASLASRSANYTIRDTFLQMLMCALGITGDKAIEIQKHWKTPKAYIDAYKALPTPEERENMVYRVAGHLQGKRQIGKAVSKRLAEIWGPRSTVN